MSVRLGMLWHAPPGVVLGDLVEGERAGHGGGLDEREVAGVGASTEDGP